MATPKRSNWVADFETTTLTEDCRVWGWGFANIETTESVDDVEIGTDIESFLDRVSEMGANIYFHNLAFDGAFIVDWLLNNGYRHTFEDNPRRGEFSTLISNMNAWYQVTVMWKNGKKTDFRDSMKKLPMSASRVATSFKLPVAKGSIDYHSPRPVGHMITAREREYIQLDVFIIAQALKVQFQAGMTKLTVGADSLAEYKRLVGPRIFGKVFPVLSDSMDAEIRAAYKGGFTYAAPQFRGFVTRRGICYDVNSLYPSVMYDRMLPFGEPMYVEDLPVATPEYPLFLVSITFTAKLKKDHVPCIQVKGSSHFVSTEYQTVIDDPITMMVSNVDLELWEDHYDLEIYSYNGGWSFQGTTGMFAKYIDKWMEVKKNNKGGMREIAKLHLNSLYGKFATNPNVTGKFPVLEDDGVVRMKMGPEETRNPVYTAMGVFITAYARDITIRAAQQHYDVFAYADTDSLHLLVDENPDTLDIHPDKLGAWKREYAFTGGVYLRAKQYAEHVGPGHCGLEEHSHENCGEDCKEVAHEHVPGCEYEVHIAGLPRDIATKVTFDDMLNGKRYTGKLQPKRVKGGIVLVDTPFHLKVC